MSEQSSVFTREQQQRAAALTAARSALVAPSGALTASGITEGDLSDRVVALVDLGEWLVSGLHPLTPWQPEPGEDPVPLHDDSPTVGVEMAEDGTRWVATVETTEHTGLTRVFLDGTIIFDGDPRVAFVATADRVKDLPGDRRVRLSSDPFLAHRAVCDVVFDRQFRDEWVAHFDLGFTGVPWHTYDAERDRDVWQPTTERPFRLVAAPRDTVLSTSTWRAGL